MWRQKEVYILLCTVWALNNGVVENQKEEKMEIDLKTGFLYGAGGFYTIRTQRKSYYNRKIPKTGTRDIRL